MATKRVYALLLSVVLTLLAGVALAGTCIEGGCHASELDYKYLHGPLAAEEAGIEGCASCHISTGAACTSTKAGDYDFAAKEDALCTTCHEKSTATAHLSRNDGCLDCHSPHGSDDDSTLQR